MGTNRKRHSQKAIKEAFCTLLLEKTIDKIFVTEICELADYSTMAFYASYEDKYDLAKKIIDDEVSLHIENISLIAKQQLGNDHLTLQSTLTITSRSFFDHVKKNKLIYECIFSSRLVQDGIAYFSQKNLELLPDAFTFQKYDDPLLDEYYSFFIEQTTVMLLNAARYWLNSDFNLSSEILAKLYTKFKTNWMESVQVANTSDSIDISIS